ncbi:hypothetical protein SAMN05519103_02591 [Rhizobiales bacterium GAS113]|nr:hypothetical protein SAMN05519103_02591 [Rhizobiales bacterium GAS113]
MSTWELNVSRKALEDALVLVTKDIRVKKPPKPKDKQIEPIRFDFSGGFLDIIGPSTARSVHANGTWPASVRADAVMMKQLAPRLPLGDPLKLKIEASRLHVGGLSIGVEVLDIAPEAILFPAEATTGDLLAAVERHGAPRVLMSTAAGALDKANLAMARDVAAAANHLADYGVTRAEVEAIVRLGLRRKAGIN